MTEPNLPIRSIGNLDPEATSDPNAASDHKPESLDTLGDLNATSETSSSKNPKAVASNTNSEVLLGRFRVQKVLGEGAFGKVYLAKDEQLNRLVAIKISKEIIHDKNVLDSFLSEAQMLAKLDHPNIVPVHDVGNSATEGFFIISKYLDGGTLSKALTTNASDIIWVCKTIAMIADGLHHAHTRGLVHRDIKPDNILLDASGSPCIVDFGLALKEESFGQGKGLTGTPLYMSPEQASGEGHRVDGRSDIFSLGVILYEMLAGRRPFEAKNVMMLLQMIKMVEVKPLRQINSKIDKELERICLKALSRKLLDRYATAADMAADLRSFLASGFMPSGNVQSAPSINIEGNKSGSKSGNISGLDSKNIQVVYKGLRSFDQSDASFFLELLPGSRDREGLPPSIRFWKTQIENPSSSFSVGVIYGPSGCGKSSLMKAGLIPNLDGKIIPIYLEATTITTEESILKQLRKRLPDLPQELTLVEAFALIRKKKPAGLNRKLLLIIDQFEQWLSANPNVDNAPLVQALRQVDGDYFQVILMIRDDFILAMNRLMAVLEIPIVESVNFSLVDLFDQKHSRKVLRLFGKALECLPEGELSKEQVQFIHKSIESLSVDGKVISVRLSVFADMMKSRPWLISSLNSIGGVEGVGVQFLEETFFSSGASALCKIHHKAAQKVLRALLPSSGSSIKGGMLSLEDLKEVSTYANKPRDFEQLLQLLDGDLRLITPTTQEDDADSKRFYQLAHDYLVPSLQEWLLRKQKETRKGRAELVLEDRSKVWNLNPEKRQLPSLPQCISIYWNVPSKDWTKPQRKMIKKASKYYLVRSILAASILLMLGFLGWDGYGRVKSQGLVERLLDANSADVPTIVKEISGYRRWANPMLSTANNKAEQEKDERKQLHTSLALLPVDKGQIPYLYSRLLEAKPNEADVLIKSLGSYKDELVEQLWNVLLKPEKAKEMQVLRTASALAAYDNGIDIKNWKKISPLIVNQLVKENPAFIGVWTEALRPVKKFLVNPLTNTFNNRAPDKTLENSLATNLLADYAADQPEVLTSLILDADEKQFALLFPVIKEQSANCLLLLNAELNKSAPQNANYALKEMDDKRKANAVVALAKLNQPETIWPLLKHTSTPQMRSYLIDKIALHNVDYKVILNQLKIEKEVSIRRALIQTLESFGVGQISLEERISIIPDLEEIYLKEPDPGIHASAEWLLKTWNQQPFINKTNEAWQKDNELTLKRQKEIKNLLDKEKEKSLKQWYVNGQGQTMVVIPGPVEFLMGSPVSEVDRRTDELQHKRKIGRSFEISNKAVTLTQYKQFDAKYTLDAKYVRSGDLPVVAINYYMAAKYCNWLNEKEGIPEDQWCFEINKQGEAIVKKDYLSLKGYRLPTEAEMEYTNRAGSISSRYFGDTLELLPKYAWLQKNSNDQPWPVGSLKPNDFGLFDSLGNCFTWCMEEYGNYPDGTAEDNLEGTKVSTETRVLRGGSFFSGASDARSSLRDSGAPTGRNGYFGCRLARTP